MVQAECAYKFQNGWNAIGFIVYLHIVFFLGKNLELLSHSLAFEPHWSKLM